MRRLLLAFAASLVLLAAPATGEDTIADPPCMDEIRNLAVRLDIEQRRSALLLWEGTELWTTFQNLRAYAGEDVPLPASLSAAEPTTPTLEFAADDPCAEQTRFLREQVAFAEAEVARSRAVVRDLKALLEEPVLRRAHYTALVDRVASETATLRGLPRLSPIDPIILDKDALKETLARLFELEGMTQEDLHGQTILWRALGLIPPDGELTDLYGKLMEAQVGGLYADHDKSLYVVDTFNPEGWLGGVILSHEITHALQDQHYDIASLPLRSKNNDRSTAMHAVLEGDATLLMGDWGAKNMTLRSLWDLREAFGGQTAALNEAPPALVQTLLFPYLGGLQFMVFRQAIGGPDWRVEPFRNPPASTEQILHPEKYLVDEPVEVHVDDALTSQPGFEVIYRTTMGEWMTRLVLTPPEAFPTITALSFDVLAKHPGAIAAAEGWEGDEVVVLENKETGEWRVYWKLLFETDEDRWEFWDATRERLAQRSVGEETILALTSSGWSPEARGYHLHQGINAKIALVPMCEESIILITFGTAPYHDMTPAGLAGYLCTNFIE